MVVVVPTSEDYLPYRQRTKMDPINVHPAKRE
jgi:hypothetical protein